MGGQGRGSSSGASPGFARSLKEQAGTVGPLLGIVTALVSLGQTFASNETTIIHFVKVFGLVMGAATAVFLFLFLAWLVFTAVIPRKYRDPLTTDAAWRATAVGLSLASLGLGMVWVERWAASDWIDAIFGYVAVGLWVWALVGLRRDHAEGDASVPPPSE
jgi:hypothetical protein